MVRNYFYFALLILIWMQKSVDAINFKDIHDINSIKKFIKGISDKTPAEYYFGKMLSDSEKNKIIVDDLVRLLRNLNDLTDPYYNASRELSVRFNTFKDNSLRKNLTAFNFMDPLNAFDNIARKINSYGDTLVNLRNHFGYNLSRYCSVISKIRLSLAQENEGSIVVEYNRAKDLRGVFYSNGRISTGLEDYISCGKRVLFGKLFYDFYRHMVTSYLKEYVIRYYLDIINAQCLDQKHPSVKIDEFIFINRLQNEISAMKSKRSTTNDYLWRCDPPNYDNRNGSLYYEMTHMIQTVIVKEEDLDIHRSCSHNCDTRYIEDSMNYTECDGYYHCRYVDSSYEICEPPASDHSPRKYQWFKDGHGKVYGDNSTECKTPVKKVSSALKVFKFRSCDYCLCACIKKKPSREDDVLFVSFREQVTDVEKNMVIVGVRFVKKNNMIHVQIKEAELKPNGLTGKSRWKKLEDFSYNKSTESFYVRHSNGSQTLLKEDIDYGRPTWMHLEDLIAPAGFAITGIALRDSNHPPPEGWCLESIRLRIRVTALDFFEGTLIKNQTEWSPRTCSGSRYSDETEFELDLPTKSPQNTIDKYRSNVLFQYSGLTKDAGQTTVPFFDGQDVEGDPEFPLGGVGVIYRKRKGYGGFLAFRIFMPIFGQNFKNDLYEE